MSGQPGRSHQGDNGQEEYPSQPLPCVCVCMHVCVCVCVCVVCVHARVHVCSMCPCVCVWCVHARVHVCSTCPCVSSVTKSVLTEYLATQALSKYGKVLRIFYSHTYSLKLFTGSNMSHNKLHPKAYQDSHMNSATGENAT